MGLSLCPIISDYSRKGSSVMGHSVPDQTLRQLKMHILRVTVRSNDLQIQTQQRSTHSPPTKKKNPQFLAVKIILNTWTFCL